MKKYLKHIIYPSYFFVLRLLRKVRLLYNPKIFICISTNKKYAEKTIPILLNSLLESGISSDKIYIFEGGYSFSDKRKDIPNYFLVDHNSFDLTALIEVCQMDMKADYWFLLHDTCIAKENFADEISQIPHYFPDVLPVKSFPSMNMGGV